MVLTDAPQIVTLAVFIASYALIFSGKFDRTTAALIGVVSMLIAGYSLHFMDFESTLGYVDWKVIVLLFGMMTFVGELAKTGFFKYLGLKTIKLARGNVRIMFIYLSLLTAVVSMFIDNVTTILLIIPLTIEATELMEIYPVPYILGEIVFSNIGGTATLIGDPPNILVGIAAHLSFNQFIVNLILPVLLSMGASIIVVRFIYQEDFKKSAHHIDEIIRMDERDYINDEHRMKILLIILTIMVIFFSLESFTGIPIAFIALIGGTISLAISEHNPQEVFKAVEWPTLVFFISLFILVGGLDATGILRDLAGAIGSVSQNPIVIAIVILWVAGLSSSVVDNIPITAALIPVVSLLSKDFHSSLFWWALVMGADIGGNITPIGSSAGVVGLGISKKLGFEIKNKEWVKMGTTTGLTSLAVCSLSLFLIAAL